MCIVAVPMEPRQRVVGGPEKMAEKKSKISASASSSDESLNHPSLIHHASRGNAQSSSSSSCCCSHCLYLSLPVSLTISLCLPPPLMTELEMGPGFERCQGGNFDPPPPLPPSPPKFSVHLLSPGRQQSLSCCCCL